MNSLLNLLSFVVDHPLSRSDRFSAILRILRWQVASRLLPGAVAVPFVGSTRLLVLPGMTGATGNVYAGLHEYEDMAFILHALRPGDLFVDVGANIGSYTVLAAGVIGVRTICFEPIPETYRRLMDNVRLNDLSNIVTAMNVAVGANSGTIQFTSDLDTMNHVLLEGQTDGGNSIQVPVAPLDTLLCGQDPTIMKIDVEGYETHVLDGATASVTSDSLMAILIELNGSGRKYGLDDDVPHRRLLDWGFNPAMYVPEERRFHLLDSRNEKSGNTLYVRRVEELRDRLQSAPAFSVLGRRI